LIFVVVCAGAATTETTAASASAVLANCLSMVSNLSE
jgi:uncharacterized membrane protein